MFQGFWYGWLLAGAATGCTLLCVIAIWDDIRAEKRDALNAMALNAINQSMSNKMPNQNIQTDQLSQQWSLKDDVTLLREAIVEIQQELAQMRLDRITE